MRSTRGDPRGRARPQPASRGANHPRPDPDLTEDRRRELTPRRRKIFRAGRASPSAMSVARARSRRNRRMTSTSRRTSIASFSSTTSRPVLSPDDYIRKIDRASGQKDERSCRSDQDGHLAHDPAAAPRTHVAHQWLAGALGIPRALAAKSPVNRTAARGVRRMVKPRRSSAFPILTAVFGFSLENWNLPPRRGQTI